MLPTRLRGAAVTLRLMPYEPPSPPTLGQWRSRYDSGGWDYLAGVGQLGHYSLLAGYLQFYECRSILDVGCGEGLLRARMDNMRFDRYVGIDPVATAVQRAQSRADARTEFVVGDVFSADLGDFDAVVCNEVLYCVPDPAAILDRARTLLRQGGYFLTSNMRHPGDAGLRRLIAERFRLDAASEIRNTSERGSHRRQVAAYAAT